MTKSMNPQQVNKPNDSTNFAAYPTYILLNSQIKTIALTVLALSTFIIALVELSGVSKTALFNKFGSGTSTDQHDHDKTNYDDQHVQEARTTQAAGMPKTTITFDTMKHDFGTIKEGEFGKFSYRFRNTGTAPLLIASAKASCGCTVPTWPKDPIVPGGEGEIAVEFDSNNRVGHQQKAVIITSNAQQEKMSLVFTADVVEK